MKHAFALSGVAFVLAASYAAFIVLNSAPGVPRFSEGLVLLGGSAALGAMCISFLGQAFVRILPSLAAYIAAGLVVGTVAASLNTWVLSNDLTVTWGIYARQLSAFAALGATFGCVAHVLRRLAPNHAFKRTVRT